MINWPGEPEITQTKVVITRIHQQIFWLNISMNDVLPVAELNGKHQLVDVLPDSIGFQAIGPLFQNLQQVLFKIFKHEIVPLFFLKGLYKSDNVLLLKLPEHFDFPESVFPYDIVVIFFFELLDGYNFARFFIFSFIHYSEGPFPHEALNFIFVHYKL